MEPTIAGFTASLLTLFDLDRTFYVPAKVQSKIALRAWWWGFILTNGLAAAALYAIFKDIEALRTLNPTLKAIVVGVTYLALIRAKFTTFNIQGKEVPFGLELFTKGRKVLSTSESILSQKRPGSARPRNWRLLKLW